MIHGVGIAYRYQPAKLDGPVRQPAQPDVLSQSISELPPAGL